VPPSEDEPGKRVVSGQTAKTTQAKTTQLKNAASARKGRPKSSRTAKARETVTAMGMGKKGEFVSLGKMFPDMPEPVRATNHLKREGELVFVVLSWVSRW
jgi:hypothetical protein